MRCPTPELAHRLSKIHESGAGDHRRSPIPWATGLGFVTATQQQDLQLQRRLQQDSIQLGGRTIYLNPFLYWRRFDSNTDRWLREPGQLTDDQTRVNRSRFYPELDWTVLDEHQTAVYDGAVEMFLKSLDLISTFHPELGAGQMLEVERKMTITKKRAFERWVDKAIRRRQRDENRESRRFERSRVWREWREWIAMDTTQKALVPLVMLMVLCGVAGWSFGAAQSACPTLSLPSGQTGVR